MRAALNRICLDEVDSTNRYLRAQAECGAEHGTLVVAARQTAGRGRLDRRFESPPGGLYLSLLLRPTSGVPDLTLLTISAALAAAEAIEEAVPSLRVGIKWVNDLYIDGRKLAGILCESALSPEGGAEYVIVGIGVNLRRGVLPKELEEIATSIEEASGALPDPLLLADAIAERMLSLAHDPALALDGYRRRMILVGRRVRVYDGERSYTARVIGVDGAGGLIVSRFGRRRVLRFGEVSLRCRK